MSAFVLSQILAGVAICFDLLSFQCKERRREPGARCASDQWLKSVQSGSMLPDSTNAPS